MPEPQAEHHHRRPVGNHSVTKLVALTLAVCTLLAVVAVPRAGADDVGDLKARADQIAQRLVSLQQQLDSLGEQFNQAQIRRRELAARKTDIERRARAARATVAARRVDVARYALSAYTGLDEGNTLSLALDGRQWDLSRRSGYAAIRIGEREQVVDDLQAAQKLDAELMASLTAATRAEKNVEANLQRQQARAGSLMASQQQLQASVNGKLADAVAARQAALVEQQASAAAGPDGASSPHPAVTSGTGSPTSENAAAGGSPETTSATPGRSTPNPTTSPHPSTPPPTTRPPVTAPPTTPPPLVSPPPAGTRGQTAARAAIAQLGVHYAWGGGNASGPSYGFGPGAGIKGFDCSGLTLYAWAQAGVSLYHSAQMQYDGSAHISLSQLQPGDLVFYGSSARTIDHVSIYVGNGQVVHAPNHTTVVQYGPVRLWPGYYAWIGAGRPG